MSVMAKRTPPPSGALVALNRVSKGNEAPIWSRMAKLASAPAGAKRVVNIKKIAMHTSDGDSVIVPGKVLGTGRMSHKVTLYSFSISKAAAENIVSAGGSVNSIAKAVLDNPTGKGLIVLG